MPFLDQKLKELKEICKDLRKTILKMTHASQSGHPGGSLSATEILVVLYFAIM